MDLKITSELLNRYAQGHCTPDEVSRVEEWLENDADPFGELGGNVGEGDPAMRDEIWQSIGAKPRRRVQMLHYWAVAAAIVIISGLAVAVYSRLRTAPAVVAVRERTVHAPAGKASILHFPDGTVIWLQGGSTVSYSEPFRSDARAVALLKGKALFEVHHDPQHPFTVAAGDASIQVLGTRFVASHEAQKVEVTLANGKVRFLTSRNHEYALAPGQQLRYDAKRSRVERVAPVDTSYAMAWTRQALWFRDTPLSEVMDELGRTYGVGFSPAPGVDLSRRMNARFEKQPLTRVLRLLTLSTGYDFSLQNNEVVIRQSYLLTH